MQDFNEQILGFQIKMTKKFLVPFLINVGRSERIWDFGGSEPVWQYVLGKCFLISYFQQESIKIEMKKIRNGKVIILIFFIIY